MYKYLLVLIALVTVSCGTLEIGVESKITPTLNMEPTSTPTPTATRPAEDLADGPAVVALLYFRDPSIERSVDYVFTGSQAVVDVLSWRLEEPAEMQFCISPEGACALTGHWLPYTRTQEIPVAVDWSGKRKFWLTVQYRDANRVVIPASEGWTGSPQAQVVLTEEIQALPPITQATIVAATQAVYPVTGSVSSGTVGASSGTLLDIVVQFSAASSAADVTEMRVSGVGGCKGVTLYDLAAAEWEPFVPEKTFQVYVPINWSPFDVAVQYRDAAGNLSPILCGDYAVEGNP